eukprot:3501568-Rhodomonas_salina.1
MNHDDHEELLRELGRHYYSPNMDPVSTAALCVAPSGLVLQCCVADSCLVPRFCVARSGLLPRFCVGECCVVPPCSRCFRAIACGVDAYGVLWVYSGSDSRSTLGLLWV